MPLAQLCLRRARRHISRRRAAMYGQDWYTACSPRNTRRRLVTKKILLAYNSSSLILIALVFRNTFQPDLAPVGIDCARTEATVNCITRLANDILKYDRIGF